MTFRRFSFALITIHCCLLQCIYSEIQQSASKQSLELASGFTKNCDKSYSATCLKLDVTNFVDKLSEQQDLGILPGISIVKETDTNDASSSEVVTNITRDYPNDIDKRLDAYLVHKVGTYLKSHAISIKLFDPRTFKAARDFNEEAMDKLGFEGRKKDKGGMGGMMAGLMMMKGTLGALGFGALAMLAGKALMTGLMALMLSAIVGIKSLASGGKKTTYEIVSKPIYTSSHTHSSEEIHGHGHGGYGESGYGRSLDEVHETVQEALRKYGNVLNRRSIV